MAMTLMIKTVGILARRSQDRPKTGLGRPKIYAQDHPRWRPSGSGGCQDGPRQAQDSGKMAQDRPKTTQIRHGVVPEGAKMAQDRPKKGPRQRQDGPRQAQDAARVAREGAKMAQDRPKTGTRYLASAGQGLKF